METIRSEIAAGFVTSFALLFLAPMLSAQIPEIAAIPSCLTGPQANGISARRAELLGHRDQLKSQVAAHNSKCANVPSGSSAEGACRGEQAELNSQVGAYATAVRQFNADVERAKSSCGNDREYKPSGNGFVGGTTWIAG